MVGLSLPNFSQLINNPLLHDPNWPAMPAKLPLDIPKFEGNPRENPRNMFTHSICGVHPIISLMTPSIFKSSNALLMDMLLSGMSINPKPLIPLLRLFLDIFLPISSYHSVMTLVTNYWLLFIKLLPLAYLKMFKNGIEGGSYVDLLNSKITSIWIGSFYQFWSPLLNILHHTSPSLKKMHSK